MTPPCGAAGFDLGALHDISEGVVMHPGRDPGSLDPHSVRTCAHAHMFLVLQTATCAS